MKRVLFLLVTFFSLQVFAGEVESEVHDNTVDVELEKGDSTKKDTYPRTLIPVLCTYTNGVIQLIFLEDLGEYTLIVTNQQTGEHWSAINDLALPTSTANGTYLVQIETEDGSKYWGTYTLW